MEKDNINEITYLILQNIYFKKKGIDTKNIDDLTKILPQRWSSLNYESRIKIMSDALKNNCSLEQSLEKKKS